MADSYLVHLPDGTEYGPIDRATLAAWHSEGRLPATALVWPHGAPEWQSVEAVLGAGSDSSALVEEPGVSPPPKKPAAAPTAGAARAGAQAAAAQAAAAGSGSQPGGTRPVAARAVTPAAVRAPAQAGTRAGARPRTPLQSARPGGTPQAVKPASPAPTPATAPNARPQAPASAAGAAAPAAAAGVHPAPGPDDSSHTRPPTRSPYASRRKQAHGSGPDPALLRRLLWAAVAVVVVLAALGGLIAVLRPLLRRSQEIAAIRRQARPERHIEDSETGLVADLPSGWYALRADNHFVSLAGARLYLAQPALSAFGTVVVARPRLVDAVDAYLDDLLQQRLARRPGTREEARSDVQLGRGRGRLVRTVWQDGARPMVAATVAWADGYLMFTLETWAPASAGSQFSAQVEELCKGLRASGVLEARVAQAVDRLALDVPELSPDVLRLLVAERMSRNAGLEGVPSEALLMVSRGLDVLTPAEAEEMRVIYQKVWDPVPETDRERMAGLLREIRAGRDVPAADLQLLREALKAGMLALEPEQRTRLQQLSGRAVRRALARP